MFFRLIASAAMAGLMFTPQLRAGEWVAVATTCAPDETSAGKFEADFGRFQFRGNNTGSVDARCNVTNPQDSLTSPNPGWGSLEISYDDPDGSLNDSQVSVTLRRVDKFTGNSFLLATFDSNSQAAGQQVRTIGFNHTFNFVNNGYYVGISVRRSTTSVMPRIQRVRLLVPPVP